ncbi:V-type ATP synthase subunit E family protein [Nocardioides dilutus]
MTAPHAVIDPTELAPVREALLRMARAEADTVLAAADHDVEGVLAAADTEAAELRDRARAQAEEDTAVLEATEHSRVLREARSIELGAELAAYEALLSAAATTARARLADDPDVVAAMTERVRRELGPGATLSRTPDGGLVGEADGRRLGLSLATLVERAVADLLASRGTSPQTPGETP